MGKLRLTRRAGEKLYIGGAVVEVERIGETRVVLVVTAPRAVEVLRSEVVAPGLAAVIETAAGRK